MPRNWLPSLIVFACNEQSAAHLLGCIVARGGNCIGTAFPWPPVVVMGACLLATIPAVVML